MKWSYDLSVLKLFSKIRLYQVPILTSILFLNACGLNQPKEEMMTDTAANTQEAITPTPPDWAKNATIYELNVRQFTEEGTFSAIHPHVQRIKDMGVKIVWFMPIQPIGELNRKGTLGSYYAIKDYTAVNPEFGTMDDFKALVNAFQSAGIKVIIDWVANHSAPDNWWVEKHKEFYTLDSTGNVIPPKDTDWYDVADLNYENKDLWKAMIDAMIFWVKETNIDGFRCDVANYVPTPFWNEARKSLEEVKNVFMLAEGEGADLHEYAFDMSYAWGYMHIANEVAQGKKAVSAIKDYLKEEVEKRQAHDYRMYFSTNHDENSWNGTAPERYGKNEDLMHVLNFTLDGMPLVYSGQESGEKKRLAFFERDPIDWADFEKQAFFQKLLQLNVNNKALWNGTHGAIADFENIEDENILAYSRSKDDDFVFVALNFSNETKNITISLPSGTKTEALDVFNGNTVLISGETHSFSLPPHGFIVYANKI